MQPWEVIKKLESDNSRLFKEAVVTEEAKNSNTEFFDGARYCLDSLRTFGVKQIPKSTTNGPGLDWFEFQQVADSLSDRELTGHAARDAIQTMMELATQDEWNYWYSRILLKDFKCGMSETTINKMVKKSHPKYLIPVFAVQLAFDGDDHAGKLIGKKQIETKMDGVRVATIVHPNGTVEQFSRNGKQLHNFELINKQFSAIAKHLDQAYVFDGEVMSANFQDLMKQLNRKKDVDTTDSVLYLFDMIPLVDFEKGYYKKPQIERTTQLQEWFKDQLFLQMLNVRVLEHDIVDLNTVEGKARFNEINEKALEGGYEGILIKDLNAPYECKRSTAWLKKKPVITVDLIIDNLEEGTGRNVGRLGAFVCLGVDNDRAIKVNCGSGFSDAQREEFWNTDLIGQCVEVMADAITQNQDGTYSLRFPRFKCFRDDK